MAVRRVARRKSYEMRSGRRVSVFRGRAPRQAALKAASRGNTKIKLREKGRRNRDRTYSIHLFEGSRERVRLPESARRVEWLPERVWRPRVRKLGIERVKRIR